MCVCVCARSRSLQQTHAFNCVRVCGFVLHLFQHPLCLMLQVITHLFVCLFVCLFSYKQNAIKHIFEYNFADALFCEFVMYQSHSVYTFPASIVCRWSCLLADTRLSIDRQASSRTRNLQQLATSLQHAVVRRRTTSANAAHRAHVSTPAAAAASQSSALAPSISSPAHSSAPTTWPTTTATADCVNNSRHGATNSNIITSTTANYNDGDSRSATHCGQTAA